MKEILSVDKQIEHMKKKGITFQYVTEQEAKEFLTNNNYYMKFAAYRFNYRKHESGKKAGQYIGLDFGCLKELSTLDMHLRYSVLEMCLDIELAIRVHLIRQITQNENEDGYRVVQHFLKKKPNILSKIQRQKSGEYCKDLIQKYYPDFPAWVFVEIISFGDLLYFYEDYSKEHKRDKINNDLLNIVRDLRNASAHSNCLMNKIGEELDETKQAHNDITEFVKNIPEIGSQSRKNNLGCKFAYNMTALLYVYDMFVPDVAKQKRYAQLQEFMSNRMIRNKSYFQSNSKICGTYNFFKKVLDKLAELRQNTFTIEKRELLQGVAHICVPFLIFYSEKTLDNLAK